MKISLSKYLIFIFISLSLVSCATVEDLKPGTGTVLEIKDRDFQEIWRAAIKTASNNLTLVYQNKALGTIKAEARAGMTTWGEVVGIFISPTEPMKGKYIVEVVSQKRSKIQLTGQDWEKAMLAGISAELDL